MLEAYLATAAGLVKCYDLKEDCIAGRGMPQFGIDVGTEVVLHSWDNALRVALGRPHRSNGPQSLVWMSLDALNIIGKLENPGEQAMLHRAVAAVAPAPLWDRGDPRDIGTKSVQAQCLGFVRHARHRADGVAFYNDLQTALHNVSRISGVIPNDSQVEVINCMHASYAEVRWNGCSVFIRKMHLQMPQTQLAAPTQTALLPLRASSPCVLEARHSNGQASVAWFYNVTAALNAPGNYAGTIPNGEKVELIDANAGGQHVYATVSWCNKDVVLRTVHLRHLPVQLFNLDGQADVAFFENVTAGQRNTPSGYLPNGTRATVDNANLDGNYTLTLVNFPMGPRVVRSVDLEGLPQRNFRAHAGALAPAPQIQAGFHQPHPQKTAHVAPHSPAPSKLTPITLPQQADLLLYSEVVVRHVERRPLVGYYFEKASAELMGTPDGTIPAHSTAVLLELDMLNRGAGGHCKIKWTQNGVPLDVYVRRAHIIAAHMAN